MLNKKIAVVVAGLNLDFKGDLFGPMPIILAKADNLNKVYTVCIKCKKPVAKTLRLRDGKPAKKTSPIILIGGKDSYTARCVNCHEVLLNLYLNEKINIHFHNFWLNLSFVFCL